MVHRDGDERVVVSQLTFPPLAIRILAAAASSIFPLDMVVIERNRVDADTESEMPKGSS